MCSHAIDSAQIRRCSKEGIVCINVTAFEVLTANDVARVGCNFSVLVGILVATTLVEQPTACRCVLRQRKVTANGSERRN